MAGQRAEGPVPVLCWLLRMSSLLISLVGVTSALQLVENSTISPPPTTLRMRADPVISTVAPSIEYSGALENVSRDRQWDGENHPPQVKGQITTESAVTQLMMTSSEHVPIMETVVAKAVTARRDRSSELVGRTQSDEERLLDALFTGYNPSARPVMNSSSTVDVQIQFSLMHIKDLDIRSQIFTTTGLLILDWRDERLTWTPKDYNFMNEVIIEAKGLWRPEFAVINGAEKIYEDYNQFRAVISKDGAIHWEPGGVFKTMCEIDITYYPFDQQTCTLTFGAWSYHTGKMNLTNAGVIVNLDSYSENGEWQIDGTGVERKEFAYENNPNEKFGFINFKMHLRRRHTFYVLNVILPSIMTSVLLLSVFFCTPGQKVQIGVVVLLSFRIFLLNVSGNIPKTSDHIPLLGIYLTCTMAITTLSMVLTVFVLNLHHISDRPVPPCIRRFVFIYLARILGMCGTTDQVLMAGAKARHSQRKFRHSNIADANVDERTAIIELHCRPGQNAGPEQNAHRGSRDPRFSSNFLVAHPEEGESDKPDDYAKDWKRLAEIFDRLFFWLFLMAILISTLILFHPLTKISTKKITLT